MSSIFDKRFPEETMSKPSDRVLSGCKEISSFLGVSVKTVHRHWKSMPVFRLKKKYHDPGIRFGGVDEEKITKDVT